jgi:hypothetical protein
MTHHRTIYSIFLCYSQWKTNIVNIHEQNQFEEEEEEQQQNKTTITTTTTTTTTTASYSCLHFSFIIDKWHLGIDDRILTIIFS